MEQLTYDRLQDNLKRLKLTRTAEVLDTVAARSEGTFSRALRMPATLPTYPTRSSTSF